MNLRVARPSSSQQQGNAITLLFSSLLWPASAITERASLCFAEEEVSTTVKNGTQRTLKPRSGSYRWICFRRFVGPVVSASIHGSSAIQTKGPKPTDRSCLRDKTKTSTTTNVNG
ncbi:unnamed protein product [Sphagnum troendelagicum]|uniref:Secreted protein n=1 Tax=Sphagnum troendelagicum TaxID=128251 RepID=A0ABP0UPI3_9BRYO